MWIVHTTVQYVVAKKTAGKLELENKNLNFCLFLKE